jgi:predicted RNA-binding Zn-ribbon protein involved in translation (DUF1610 family)
MSDTAGFHDGKHYTEWVDEVKALKRAGRLDDTVRLLLHLVNAVETEQKVRRCRGAPWYYEQLAVVYRKQGNPSAEVAILEQYVAKNKQYGSAWMDTRLRAARALVAAKQDAGEPVACPSCGTVLENAQIRSSPCPHCGEPIVVRRRLGQPVLFTAAGDGAEKAATAATRHREKMLRRANMLGITDAEFAPVEAELTRRFGRPADPADVFWSLANERAIAYASAGDWFPAASVYWQMAEHVVGEGRPWEHLSAEAIRCVLRGMVRSTDPATRMVIRGCSCWACIKSSAGETTFAKIQANPQLPHGNCAKPPCKCHPQRAFDNPSEPAVQITPSPSGDPAGPVGVDGQQARQGSWARMMGNSQ